MAEADVSSIVNELLSFFDVLTLTWITRGDRESIAALFSEASE
jgi:hypothetical protein